MSNKKQVFLSLETAKKMYNSSCINLGSNFKNDCLLAFLLENFTKEELEAKELPKSFKELKLLHGYYITNNSEIMLHSGNHSHLFHKNVFPTKELAEASLALSQLLQLRDVYNGDWKVDLNKKPDETRYIIRNYCNLIDTLSIKNCINSILSFKDCQTRDLFAENFKDLITAALPLL